MKKITSAIEWLIRKSSLIYRVLALICTIILIIIMFPQKHQGTHYDYSVGSFWKDNDLYAPYDFQILKDEDARTREIAAAKSKSTLYYQIDSSAQIKAHIKLNNHRGAITTAKYLEYKRAIDTLYQRGYIEVTDDYPDIENHTIVILSGNIGSEHTTNEFVTRNEINDSYLADSIVTPNIKLDVTRTQLELDSRLSQIDYSSKSVYTGELIVAKGEHITAEKAAVLSSLEQENDKRFVKQFNPYAHYFGRFMLCAIAFAALIMFLNLTNPRLLRSSKSVIIMLMTILLMTSMTAFVLHTAPRWVLLVPLCIGPILMHVIFDMRAALYIHLTTIVILGHMVPDSFEFIFYQLITGMMSIITVKDFEKRSRFFIVSAVIFMTYSLIYTCGILWQDTNLDNLRMDRYVMFMFNAVLTLLAHPIIYIYEKVFKITTNLTLMEIASTDTPALRELSRKAPGTFQHVMQVANLSEDIINEIGGNALLAKVGALYHDIGKLKNPIYFTENQTSDFNPHSELPYTESSKIIIQHVLDGIDIAHHYHLPEEVIDFIRSHHGTTQTGYFYTKYKNEHPNEEIDPSAFTYPGPKPHTKETAVVMIVDSVEAACKGLKEHDKEHIDKMVDNIIFGKIESGQVKESSLTFQDVTEIRKMLKNKMLSIYHARISYPVAK